jgi:hypothetical protein
MHSHLWVWRVLAPSLIASAAACNSVSRGREEIISTVRVLGVRSEPASVAPGQSSELEILCADGRPNVAGRPSCNVEVAWFSGCTNPHGSDPYSCLAGYGAITSNLASPISATAADARFDGYFGFGPKFTFLAPPTVLTQSTDVNGLPVRYGVSHVFFGVCAGSLFPRPPADRTVPLECRDPSSGQVLGQDRFVVGYTTIYSYDVVENENPVIATVEFDGSPIASDPCTSDADCAASFGCRSAVCVPRVPVCRNGECREHRFEPRLTPDSYAIRSTAGDGVSIAVKNVWVRYYATGGHLSGLGALLERTDGGGQAAASDDDSPATRWVPPADPDTDARIWAVVRDDRGGMAWAEQRVIVE